MVSLQERLKTARQYAGLTQATLSEMINISVRTLKNYENDASKITVTTVQNIALKCGVSEFWLLTGQGEMIPPKTPELSHKCKSSNIVEFEHMELVKRFKNKEKGKLINEQLIELESISEKVFQNVANYIQNTLENVRIVKDELVTKQSGRQGGKKERKKA